MEAYVASAGLTGAYQADDFRPAALSPNFVSIPDAVEGETVVAEVPVELSEPVDFPVTVDYESGSPEGYAQSPEDFVAVTGTLTFLPGETNKTIPVTINGGRLEGDEEQLTVLIGFTNPANAVVSGFLGLGGVNIVKDV